MYCSKCGEKITDNSKFCKFCGEPNDDFKEYSIEENSLNQLDSDMDITNSHSTSDELNLSDPPIDSNLNDGTDVFNRSNISDVKESNELNKKPNKKLIMFSSIFIILVIASYSIFNIAKSSGVLYFFTVMIKTEKAYEKEISLFVDKNDVLSQAKKYFEDSHTFTLNAPEIFDFKYTDYKKEKTLEAGLSFSDVPIDIGFFLTDERMILGSKQLAYFEANPKNLGQELSKMALNLKLDDYGIYLDDYINLISKYDYSYSNIGDMKENKLTKEQLEIAGRYSKIFVSLIKKSEYKKESSKISLEDKQVKGKILTLTWDNNIILDWLKNDLLTTLKTDTQLKEEWKKYIKELSSIYSDYYIDSDFLYDESLDFNDFIEQFEEIIEQMEYEDYEFKVALQLSVVNDVIVIANFKIYDEYSNEVLTFEVGSIGSEYRLNSIYFKYFSDYDYFFEISAKGDHIDSKVINSDIVVEDEYGKEKVSFEWDTTLDKDNFIIKSDGEKVIFTFAKSDSDIIFKEQLTEFNLEATLSEKLNDQKPSLPTKTFFIDTIDMEKLQDIIEPLFNSFF